MSKFLKTVLGWTMITVGFMVYLLLMANPFWFRRDALDWFRQTKIGWLFS